MNFYVSDCAYVQASLLIFWPGLSHPGRERIDQIFMEVPNGNAFQQGAGGATGTFHTSEFHLNCNASPTSAVCDGV